MERKIFWIVVVVLGLPVVLVLPLWSAVIAVIPVVIIAWWAGYESDWVRRYSRINQPPSTSNKDKTDRDAA